MSKKLSQHIRETLKVKTFVAHSPISGRGLFSGGIVPAGSTVSTWDPPLDGHYPADYPESLPPDERTAFTSAASKGTDGWYISGDGGVYINHSNDPNVRVTPGDGEPATWDRVATRDIAPGEEITMDYGEVGTDTPDCEGLIEAFVRGVLREGALPQRFYHGSAAPLKIGMILGGRPFKSHFGDAEKLLEAYRPEGMVSRLEAVYMTGRPGDISIAGGETDYVYLLEPLDPPQKHHGGWIGDLYNLAMGDADKLTKNGPVLHSSTLKRLLPEAERAATAYWSGRPYKGSGEVWEYLCSRARVVKEVK